MKHKIRLPGSTARFLLKQLEKDTEILCSLGVMDYSLLGKTIISLKFYSNLIYLVGVHNTDYVVDDVFDPSIGFKPNSVASGGFESRVVAKSRRRDSSLGGGGAGPGSVLGGTGENISNTTSRSDESLTPKSPIILNLNTSQFPTPTASSTNSEEKNGRIIR